MSDTIALSKWWQTPSAQAAIQRAADERRRRLEQVKEQFKARKEELRRAVEQESEVTQ
jgi:ribosome-associated translation inhibitor RaiA